MFKVLIKKMSLCQKRLKFGFKLKKKINVRNQLYTVDLYARRLMVCVTLTERHVDLKGSMSQGIRTGEK